MIKNPTAVVTDEAGTTATVTLASTAPVAADKGLVVSLSPNGNQAKDATLAALSAKFSNGQVAQSSAVGVSIGLNPTFVAASAAFTPQASATDIFYLKAGSKTVNVTRLWISAVRTWDDSNVAVAVIKRSTANSAGTAISIVPHFAGETSDATVWSYTTNPTAGTEVGKVWTGYVSAPQAGYPGLLQGSRYTWEWEAPSSKRPIVLRASSADGIAVNLAGGNPDDLIVYCGAEWYEL